MLAFRIQFGLFYCGFVLYLISLSLVLVLLVISNICDRKPTKKINNDLFSHWVLTTYDGSTSKLLVGFEQMLYK